MPERNLLHINADLSLQARKRIEAAAKKYYPNRTGNKGNMSAMVSEILEDWRMGERKRK